MRLVGFAAVAALLLAGTGLAKADPVTIKVGWVVLTSSSVPLSLENKELLQHYGQSYVIEPVSVRATSAMITALGTGDVNVGTLAYSSLAFAIQNAKLDDLRIISDVSQNRAEDSFTTKFMVLKDGPIKKIEDLKGKVAASLAAGSAVDIAMRAMLRRHHLDDKKDVTIIEGSFPNMKSILLSKRADMVSVMPPFDEDAAMREQATTLFTQKDSMGPVQLIVWAGRAGFINEHRAAMVDFMEDSLRVTRWLMDPANHEEVIDRVAKDTKQPREQLDMLFTSRDSYRDPNGMPNLTALQHNIDTQREIGLIDKSIAVKDYADLSIVQEATTRLPKK